MITDTLPTPYYAVIFTSLRSGIDNGYKQTSERMMELAKQQRGFLGADSARGEIRITVSYWKDVEAIKNWKENAEHTIAREKGKKGKRIGI